MTSVALSPLAASPEAPAGIDAVWKGVCAFTAVDVATLGLFARLNAGSERCIRCDAYADAPQCSFARRSNSHLIQGASS
jgi:hypothetical protein